MIAILVIVLIIIVAQAAGLVQLTRARRLSQIEASTASIATEVFKSKCTRLQAQLDSALAIIRSRENRGEE